MIRLKVIALILFPGLLFADSLRSVATQLCFERHTNSQGLFSMRGLQYALTPGLKIKVERCVDQIVEERQRQSIYSVLDHKENDQTFREEIRAYESTLIIDSAAQNAPLARETLSISNNPEDSSDQLDVVEGYSIIKE